MSNYTEFHKKFPISIREFIFKYMDDETIFDVLPEFSFIKDLAVIWKKQNCACGLGEKINKVTMEFNEFVINDLTIELAAKVAQNFQLSSICFMVQTRESFSTKCF